MEYVEIHPNALKHLSKEEVLAAWGTARESVRREREQDPPRWLSVGWLPDGRSVELIAVETSVGWLVIHAMSPVQPKFANEMEKAKRRRRR